MSRIDAMREQQVVVQGRAWDRVDIIPRAVAKRVNARRNKKQGKLTIEQYRLMLQRKAEAAWGRSARQLKGADWLSLVESLPDTHIQIKVASVIWWDYCGNLKPSKEWHHLDKHVHRHRAGMEFNTEQVRDGLVACGYPGYMAVNRTTRKDKPND